MRTRLFALFLITSATPALAQMPSYAERRTPELQPTISNSEEIPHLSYDASFSQGGDAIPALPLEVMKSGTIRYINGGIGDEELAQVKAQATQYNLHIMLSSPQGEYITNAHLRVLAEDGTALLDIADVGPYLYAALPAGKYTLETTMHGEEATTNAFEITARNGFTKHIISSK